MQKEFNKFNEIFKAVPGKKKSLLTLGHKGVFSHGIFNREAEEREIPELKEKKIDAQSIAAVYKSLSSKYAIDSIQNIDEDDLIDITDELWNKKHNDFQGANYYTQVRNIYKATLSSGSKKSFIYGNKKNIMPKENFLLNIFNSIFVRGYSTKKNLLFALVDELHDKVDLMLLSFNGKDLYGFSNLEKEQALKKGVASDFLDRLTIKRLLARLEKEKEESFYAICTTKSIWLRCLEKQEKYGERAAWRQLLRANKAKRSRREVLLLEPEEWSLRFSMFLKSIF